MKEVVAKGSTARTKGGDRVFVSKERALPGFDIDHDVIYISRLRESDVIMRSNGYAKAEGLLEHRDRVWAAVKRWADWIDDGRGNYTLEGAVLQDMIDVVNVVKVFGGPKESLEPVREGIRALKP